MSVHEPRPASSAGVEAYILDMLAQLASMAQANGLSRLARSLRIALRELERDAAA